MERPNSDLLLCSASDYYFDVAYTELWRLWKLVGVGIDDLPRRDCCREDRADNCVPHF